MRPLTLKFTALNERNGNATLPGLKGSVSWLILAAMLLLGLIIRLDDLTDPPLDYHPTRQLWSALIARGMYYEHLNTVPTWKREMAVEQWKTKGVLEPQVMETLAAAGYRLLGGETLWLPRLYSILFWILAAIPLFCLARDLAGIEAGLIAASIYLFYPYGVIASRSFQPEPLMVALLVTALWGLYRWRLTNRWSWAILAGIFSGMAVFIKVMAASPLAGGMLALFLAGRSIRQAARDPQVWAIGLIAFLPNLFYFLYGTFIAKFLTGSLDGRFFPELLVDPWFYIRWELKIAMVTGQVILGLAILGVLLSPSRIHRWLMIGVWLGYALYSLILNYQTSTHDYYHLLLLPIAALSLAPLAARVCGWFLRIGQGAALARRIPAAILWGLFLVWVGLASWRAHTILHEANYRNEPVRFAEIEKSIGHQSRVIALTEDYGYRMVYWGWIDARIWPSYGDQNYLSKLRNTSPEFRNNFKKLVSGTDVFLITWFADLDYQPELKAYLLENYPKVAESDQYWLFDLRHPKISTIQPN